MQAHARAGSEVPCISTSLHGGPSKRSKSWPAPGRCLEHHLLPSQAEKNQYRLINSPHVVGIEIPDAVPHFAFWHRRDLVHHEPRVRVQSISCSWRDRNTKQRCFRLIACHNADRNRCGCVKAIILQNNGGARLARVICAPSYRPYFAALQSVLKG